MLRQPYIAGDVGLLLFGIKSLLVPVALPCHLKEQGRISIYCTIAECYGQHKLIQREWHEIATQQQKTSSNQHPGHAIAKQSYTRQRTDFGNGRFQPVLACLDGIPPAAMFLQLALFTHEQ
jgi:hypothetical protein